MSSSPSAPVEERKKESSDDDTAVPSAEPEKKEELLWQVVADACTCASCAQKRFMDDDDSPPLLLLLCERRKYGTAVPSPEPEEPEELWLTLADAAMIARTEVRYGDDSPLPKTFTDVLRSWRWQDDRKDPAPPPPQSEEEEHYITQEDMCAIAQAEVRRHFMSFSSLDERRGKNDPRWKR